MQIIRGGLVLRSAETDAAPADILVDGGLIREIGPPGMVVPDGTSEIDATRRLLIPGLVNAHTHSHYAFGKGLGDRWTLEMMLNAAPGITGDMTAEELHLSTLVCAMEMVRKGATACYDLVIQAPVPSPELTDAIAGAYAQVGMRAVIAFQMADTTFWQSIPGLIDAIPDSLGEPIRRIAATPHEKSLEACRRVLAGWRYDRDFIRPALAPSIPLLCSDAFLVAAARLSREEGIGLHTHLAETKVQAVTALKRYGRSLAAHLDALGYLGPNFTAAHGVWLDADDMRRLAGHSCGIAHNPESNLRLGSGIAAVHEMRQAGLTVGIGTDAATCSDQLNMFESLRLAALASRATSPDPERWLGAADVFAMATTGSAKVTGLERSGRLDVGSNADIVFLDLDNLNYVPFNRAINHIVFNENGSGVDSVMIAGRMVLDHGRFPGIDERAVIRRIEAAAERLRSANATRRAELAAVDAIVSRFCVGLASSPHPVCRHVQ